MGHATGLSRAYSSADGTYLDHDVLYVAGTRSFKDAVGDLLIPMGLVDQHHRYRAAAKVVHNNDVSQVVGHSLGGSVALALERDQPTLHATTYGAPTMLRGPGDRHRDLFDPISMFDLTAQQHGVPGRDTLRMPHSYKG